MINDSQLRKEVRHAVCQYVEYFVNEFQLGQIKRKHMMMYCFLCGDFKRVSFGSLPRRYKVYHYEDFE